MCEYKFFKVSELIERLSKYPDGATVVIVFEDFAYRGIQGFEFDKDKNKVYIMSDCAMYNGEADDDK
jgi:hypothetical protein